MTEMTGVTYVGGILGFKVVSGEKKEDLSGLV